tara:strand:- start:47699 stop:48646 length:948 start_codon:yes stop_codon:yes gene_type:complete
MESFGSSQNEAVDSQISFSSREYNDRATKIINDGKRKLQRSIPNSINNQIGIIENTLYDIQEQPLMSFSYEETNMRVGQVQAKSIDYLLVEEIKTNQIYYEIVNELVLLNDQYFNHWQDLGKTIEFEDYYEVTPIIIAGEDVLSKIDELIKDEEKRDSKEDRDLAVGVGISLITCIPGTAAAMKTLESIKKGAQFAKNSLLVAKSTNSITRITSKVLNEKTASVFTTALSNVEKRNKLAINLNRVRTAGVAGEVTYNVAPFVGGASLGYTIAHFKSEENKIEGRIGDFSDGIISQAIGRLRNILIQNQKIISEVE